MGNFDKKDTKRAEDILRGIKEAKKDNKMRMPWMIEGAQRGDYSIIVDGNEATNGLSNGDVYIEAGNSDRAVKVVERYFEDLDNMKNSKISKVLLNDLQEQAIRLGLIEPSETNSLVPTVMGRDGIAAKLLLTQIFWNDDKKKVEDAVKIDLRNVAKITGKDKVTSLTEKGYYIPAFKHTENPLTAGIVTDKKQPKDITMSFVKVTSDAFDRFFGEQAIILRGLKDSKDLSERQYNSMMKSLMDFRLNLVAMSRLSGATRNVNLLAKTVNNISDLYDVYFPMLQQVDESNLDNPKKAIRATDKTVSIIPDGDLTSVTLVVENPSMHRVSTSFTANGSMSIGVEFDATAPLEDLTVNATVQKDGKEEQCKILPASSPKRLTKK